MIIPFEITRSLFPIASSRGERDSFNLDLDGRHKID
jgi:hypothetical protein